MPIPITKKKWRETRPSSCKASGVGAACDEYAKFCLPPPNLRTEESVVKARDTVSEFQMALRDALGKMKPKDKEYADTKDLIEDWLKQVKEYQGAIAKIVKREAEDKEAEYAETLRAWAERKDELVTYFKDAAGKFDRVVAAAEEMVRQADQLAKSATAEPAKAREAITAIQGLLDKVTPFQGKLEAANAEALKKFDPHRSGSGPESAKTLGIEAKDAAPYKGIFTIADNLRKQMVEQAKSMSAHEDSISTSLEEARMATLSAGEKEAGYVKLATDLQVKIRALTDRISSKGVGAKNILDTGKEYKETFDTFVGTVTGAEPSKKNQMRELAETRATQKYEQVKELEAGLNSTFNTALQMMKRAAAGIPKDFQTRPAIKKEIDGAVAALKDARAFLDRFIKARTEAEGPYQAALKAIQTG